MKQRTRTANNAVQQGHASLGTPLQRPQFPKGDAIVCRNCSPNNERGTGGMATTGSTHPNGPEVWITLERSMSAHMAHRKGQQSLPPAVPWPKENQKDHVPAKLP